MTCCFFGHREVEDDIESILKETIVQLINEGVKNFYVGNHGAFDKMVYRVLKKICEENPTVKFAVVLAYLSTKGNNYSNSIYPEGLEKVPMRFAISHRNKWMIDKSDYVIVYVKRNVGGAVQFYEMAKRKGKKVINIAEKF